MVAATVHIMSSVAQSNVNKIIAGASPAINGYTEFDIYMVKLVATPTGDLTVNIDGQGEIPVVTGARQIVPGLVMAKNILALTYNTDLIAGGCMEVIQNLLSFVVEVDYSQEFYGKLVRGYMFGKANTIGQMLGNITSNPFGRRADVLQVLIEVAGAMDTLSGTRISLKKKWFGDLMAGYVGSNAGAIELLADPVQQAAILERMHSLAGDMLTVEAT